MGDKDICGAETTQDHPCQNDADSCPWHGEDATAEPRKTPLEETPEIKDIVTGALQSGATVPEACSEAGISKSAYYRYRDRGNPSDNDDPKDIFREFWEETTQARRVASREDRRRMKDKCIETGDTRTWYKIHHDQYGDTYGKEEPEERETGNVINIPDSIAEEWTRKPTVD